DHVLGHLPRELSNGQKQRTSLARSLVRAPGVLLLDDPLRNVDAKLRYEMRLELPSLLRASGATVLYVTQDYKEAMALGDRIVVMERGRIAQAGTPQEIYHHPATPFVADFIGTMNRLSRRTLPSHVGADLGESVTHVMFRPEDVRIVPAGRHHLEAKVVSSFFLGDHTRLVVDVGGAAPLVVETTERRKWPRGETVHLALAEGAILAVPGQAP
ncbi:MAG TPA: ABC transporter ATP-binding protein, partial [Usitatibacter sp.]|nr:ABC transporter ATP-binding protein [Usitatibacter sp.]